jgi:hypothetical protein
MSERAATMDAVDCVCTALRALIAMRVLLAAQQPKLGCVAAHECAMIPVTMHGQDAVKSFAPRCGR